MTHQKKLGLVLTGGGARGAYQAGVLRGIADIYQRDGRGLFQIVTGVSAGAINAAAIASFAHDFGKGAEALWNTWAEISTEQVFRNDPGSIARLIIKWGRDLLLGGVIGGSSSTHLLDTAPLGDLLRTRIDFARIHQHVSSGQLHAFAVSATNYGSGAAATFFDAQPNKDQWSRSSRLGIPTRIDVGHVLASSAIPVFFPPVALRGSYWGDGCIRLTAPLSPAIHLGADAIIAVGIRHPRTPEAARIATSRPMAKISAVAIAGALLNAVFLDSLEEDIERMQRINRTVQLAPARSGQSRLDALREVSVCALLPSQDLGYLAAAEFGRLPRTLRYMFRGLGASDQEGWDLLSYLAFDRSYARRLLEVGRADAHAQTQTIRALIEAVQK